MTNDNWLYSHTGRRSPYWIDRVQKLIWQHVDDPDAVHPDTHVAGWIADLGREVEAAMVGHVDRSKTDENIAGASVLAVILATWSARIAHAKAFDPRRPLHLRKPALWKAHELARAIVDGVMSDELDTVYFEQPWEHPYVEGATDGTFI